MIVTARKLARASPRRPRQAELKRAVSTAYYALFHSFARDAADLLVGVGNARPDKAWAHAYRSLQHGDAKSACEGVRNLGFPKPIVGCADAFVTLQQKRHEADYDPDFSINRADVLELIALAAKSIVDLRSVPRRDRKAFAVKLLLRRRR